MLILVLVSGERRMLRSCPYGTLQRQAGGDEGIEQRTRIALASHGIVDPYLERVTEAVRARRAGK